MCDELLEKLIGHLIGLGYTPHEEEDASGRRRIIVQIEEDRAARIGLVHKYELCATGHVPGLRMIQQEYDLRPYGDDHFIYRIDPSAFI